MNLDHLPGVAEVAIQSGQHAAQIIIQRSKGDTAPRPFHFPDLGTMATISQFRAVAAIGRLRASGFPAWVAWLVFHLVALTGFKNRTAVLFHWSVGFLSGGRPEGVMTAQQVFVRLFSSSAAR